MIHWVSWAGYPSVLSCVEAAEQIGRGERHGGLFKENMAYVVNAHKVTGKAEMKMAAAVVISNKNELCRKGGIAPAQWVLGKYPRYMPSMLEEEELGQLGALDAALDPATEFGRRAQYRLTSKKGFVKQDCGSRYMRAQTRKAAPINKEYKAGDMVMYRRDGQSSTWCGPCRILGLENKVAWGLHAGVPVAASLNRIRPANVSEILAHVVLARQEIIAPVATERASGSQQGFLDLTGRRRDEDADDEETTLPPSRRRRHTTM
jgi:hypothetical protein